MLYQCMQATHRYLRTEQSSAVVEGSGASKEFNQFYKFFNGNTVFNDSERKVFENAVHFATIVNMGKKDSSTTGATDGGKSRPRRGGGPWRGGRSLTHGRL